MKLHDGTFRITGRVAQFGYCSTFRFTEDELPGAGEGFIEICISGPSVKAVKAAAIKLGMEAELINERRIYRNTLVLREADLIPISPEAQDGRLLKASLPEPSRTGQTGWLNLRLPE
jgi:hypothetical protein